jgi:hypothetical protein
MGTARDEQLVPQNWGFKRTFAIVAIDTVLAVIVSSIILHFTVLRGT